MRIKEVLRHAGCESVRCGDDVVRIGTGRARYADAERAILALDPERIELLDRDGAVLRVIDLRADDGDTDERHQSAQLDLVSLARVISDVADRSAQRHAEAYQAAFKAQTELVRVIADRLQGLERAWHRVIVQEYERASASAAGGEDSTLDALASHVITLAAGGKKE